MIYTYDGTFNGLLSVVFHIYEKRFPPLDIICREKYAGNDLFNPVTDVETDPAKAARVYKGLQKKISMGALNDLSKAFHTEQKNVELILYNYMRHVFNSRYSIESDNKNDLVMHVRQLVKIMDRDIHRMQAFVRFKLTEDGIYAATILPDHNVLSFIGTHFKNRYPNHQWLIYDVRRDYGIYHNLRTLEKVKLKNMQLSHNQQLKNTFLSAEDVDPQQVWQKYFGGSNVEEPQIEKLHLQTIIHNH